MIELDEEKIHPEIAGMAKELLDKYTLEDVVYNCREVSEFYKWSKALVKKLETFGRVVMQPETPLRTEKRMESRKRRQRQIFEGVW